MTAPFWTHLVVPAVCLAWGLGKMIRFFWRERPRRPQEDGYGYIYVEEDGSARELSWAERSYLERECEPFDGARPYIKGSYEERTPDNRISGFLLRRRLPQHIAVRLLAQ